MGYTSEVITALTAETKAEFVTLVNGLESVDEFDEAFWVLRRVWDEFNATEPPKYAVGDYVEFDDNEGQLYYGVVTGATKKKLAIDAKLVVDGVVAGSARPYGVPHLRIKRRLRLEE